MSVEKGRQKTQYFAYHDHKLVSFITNVFLASMDAKVVVLQSDGTPLLPAYNKYIGGCQSNQLAPKVLCLLITDVGSRGYEFFSFA